MCFLELISPEVYELQKEAKDDVQITNDMEREIECPSCYDMMTLSSQFDK